MPALLLIILFLISYTFLSFGCNQKSGTSYDYYNSTDQRIDAKYYCIEQVKNTLKAPSTAKFPSIIATEENVRNIGYLKYEISSYVDAQNSFGAKLRKNFVCTVSLEEEGKGAYVEVDYN